ncbi:hypothetical protein NDU88_002233 [Pleurodeles waltl]|uniref:Uncharacterized protein n=1 Tax=Pleurodeles waltl TaxID=8319 RepID=A0AAV7WPA5_PLEWA|nr:hypothetical protein NDU88_002233 [Pleurodeles waltl]
MEGTYRVGGPTDVSGADVTNAEGKQNGALLRGGARFSGALLRGGARFSGAFLCGGALFSGALLHGGARFSGALLRGGARFSAALLCRGARFSGALLCGGARFSGALLHGGALFSGALLCGAARFSGALLHGGAWFSGALLRGGARFSGALLCGAARFSTALLCGGARFSGALLHGRALFSGACPVIQGSQTWPGLPDQSPSDRAVAGPFGDGVLGPLVSFLTAGMGLVGPSCSALLLADFSALLLFRSLEEALWPLPPLDVVAGEVAELWSLGVAVSVLSRRPLSFRVLLPGGGLAVPLLLIEVSLLPKGRLQNPCTTVTLEAGLVVAEVLLGLLADGGGGSGEGKRLRLER